MVNAPKNTTVAADLDFDDDALTTDDGTHQELPGAELDANELQAAILQVPWRTGNRTRDERFDMGIVTENGDLMVVLWWFNGFKW